MIAGHILSILCRHAFSVMALLFTSAQVFAAVQPNAPSSICIQDSSGQTTCTSNAASTGSIRWHPGHYLAANTTAFASTRSERTVVFDKLATYSNYFQGAKVIYPWGSLEQTQGVYNWTEIDHDIAYLDAQGRGKKLLIYVWNYRYGSQETAGSGGNRAFPDYVISGGGVLENPSGSGQWGVDLDNSKWMNAYKDLIVAIGKRYNGNVTVEGIVTTETAHSHTSLWKGIIDDMKTGSPNMNLFILPNWMDTVTMTQEVVTEAIAQDVGLGGPDTLPAGNSGEDMVSRVWRGAGSSSDYVAGNYGTTSYRGTVPYHSGYEALRSITPAQLVGYAVNTLRATHVTWSVSEDQSAALNFSTGVLPAVIANPVVATSCPTSYAGACNTD